MALEMDEFTLLANFLEEYPDYGWVTATDAYNCLSVNPLATPADLYWFVQTYLTPKDGDYVALIS